MEKLPSEPYFLTVTEIAGSMISEEQIQRLCNRYYWAERYCADCDVLEISCGTGSGLGYLARSAKKFFAGDYSAENLGIMQAHYSNRISVQQFDVQALPYADDSFDVIVFLEALYFIPSASKAIAECKRVLRNGGKLLLSMPNKDLYDFHTSNYAFEYHGAVELRDFLLTYGFTVEMFGDIPLKEISLIQRITRPLKALAVKTSVIPQTKRGKQLLRRLIFGKLIPMPAEITSTTRDFKPLTQIRTDEPDRTHKILLLSATLHNK